MNFSKAVVPTNTSGCSITTTSTTTDSLGQAKTYLIVGSAHAGSYTVTATSAGLTNSPLSFTATATRSGTRFLWKNH